MFSDKLKQSKDSKELGWKKPAAALALLGAVAASAVGCGTSSGDHNPTTKAESGTSAKVNPSDKPSSESNPETSSELNFGLDAEQYIDNPEQLMPDFVDDYNTWQNTGFTKEAGDADARFKMSDPEYASTLNAAPDAEFVKDALVPDWQSNPRLVEWVNTSESVHNTNTTIALKTGDGSVSSDVEPYKRYIDLDSDSVVVGSHSPNKIVTSATWSGRDNRNMNHSGSIIDGVDPNGETGAYTLTFVKVDGQMKLANVAPYNG